MKRNFCLYVLGWALVGTPLFAAHFTIDPMHSDVTFKIRHLMVSKVSGRFGNFSGEFNYDEKNPAAWSATATIEAASIDTNNEKRDAHLRTPDFFDVAKYPVLAFKSTGVQNMSGNRAQINGMLMMHGVENPVTLDLEMGGIITEAGATKAGFEATTKLNRKDFGINYNKILDNGGLALGEDVEISIHVEGNMDTPKKAPKSAKPAEMKKEPAKKK